MKERSVAAALGQGPGLGSREEPMDGKHVGTALAALVAATALAAPALAQNEQFIPQLVYRTGAYAPNGIPVANGIADTTPSSTDATAASTASRSYSRNATPVTEPIALLQERAKRHGFEVMFLPVTHPGGFAQ
jgi:hypothetical protein